MAKTIAACLNRCRDRNVESSQIYRKDEDEAWMKSNLLEGSARHKEACEGAQVPGTV